MRIANTGNGSSSPYLFYLVLHSGPAHFNSVNCLNDDSFFTQTLQYLIYFIILKRCIALCDAEDNTVNINIKERLSCCL